MTHCQHFNVAQGALLLLVVHLSALTPGINDFRYAPLAFVVLSQRIVLSDSQHAFQYSLSGIHTFDLLSLSTMPSPSPPDP